MTAVASIRFFPLKADYDVGLSNLIRANGFRDINRQINSKNFPNARRGQAMLETAVIYFGWPMEIAEIAHDLEAMYFRSAELMDLLIFNLKYPGVQLVPRFNALGLVYHNAFGLDLAPYIYLTDEGRELQLDHIGDESDNLDCYLAIKK